MLNMKKSMYILLQLLFFILLFSSCTSQESVYPSKEHIKIEVEPEYSIYDDILVNISIGLCKDYQDNYNSRQNFKYILAYSSAYPETDYEEHTILFTITDFSSEVYYYTMDENRIIYSFKKTFLIEKEIFADTKGEFYVFMYSTVLDFSESESTIIYRINYEKNNEVLELHLS